ncbi:stage VI sporulation protein D [Cytobacillus sp. FJAT-53684]|uniref:Stage VI sporulation protein D n=1 Tax=Cytobacillus mangrovibacter TaxID=3299024 RepID=A0ABW6K1P7_9BACI
MSQENPSCLRFSLEESVWFQKGQEVLDLISISLDPDIFIQENDQYVTIQGALELTGEYKRNETGEQENENPFATPKFIQVVEERGEGLCEFTHYFPVDITIPNNRIKDINQIDVQVESFDYVFPERSCMKLSANLMILGLYGEQQHNRPVEAVEEEEYESLYRSSAASVEVDVNLFEKPSDDVEEEVEEERTEILLSPSNVEVDGYDEGEKLEKDEVEEIYAPFEAEARKQPALEIIEEDVREEKIEEVKPEISFSAQRSEEPQPSAEDIFGIPDESPIQAGKPEEVEMIEQEVKLESPEKVEEAPEKNTKQKKKSKKKSMSLTEFFARKEEADDVAKLKVCIVQNGDTIDTIAERYDVGVHHLLSVNHLEINQDIFEGQVLYIPIAVAR